MHCHQDVIDEAGEYKKAERFGGIYNRRALVERKLSELLWKHRLKFRRYIGATKRQQQATWTATVANLKRLWKLVPEMPAEEGAGNLKTKGYHRAHQ